MKMAKERGIPVIGWTVNKKSKIQKLFETDITYLLTDRLDIF